VLGRIVRRRKGSGAHDPISHLSGSLQGRISTSAKPTLRVGRASDCDVRFDKQRDPKVSNHHAEFLFEDGCWFVVDTASTNGTLVEGRRIAKHRLRQGEEVQLGTGGPLVRVEFDAKDGMGGAMKTEAASITAIQRSEAARRGSSPPRIDATAEMNRISSDLKSSADTANAVGKNTIVGVMNARTPAAGRSAIVSGLMETTTAIRPVSAAAEVPRRK